MAVPRVPPSDVLPALAVVLVAPGERRTVPTADAGPEVAASAGIDRARRGGRVKAGGRADAISAAGAYAGAAAQAQFRRLRGAESETNGNCR